MTKSIHLKGMHGLGDNLHQRAVLRELFATGHRVWLETPWPSVYHDLVGAKLHLLNKASALRTQAKNAKREAHLYTCTTVPAGTPWKQVWYKPEAVRRIGSVLGAMCESCDVPVGDFRLPVPGEWHERAYRWLDQWRPRKPMLIYRPLVERKEWGGCPARNPDHAAYAKLFASIRDRFFVVSLADLQDGAEWMVGHRIQADVELHRGELEFETIAALIQQSSLVFSSPGFAVVLAQAVGTPVCCVFGGYENASSFSAGARFSPYLGIEPIKPCNCFQHNHPCDKRIDLPAAIAKLQAFVAGEQEAAAA